MNTQCKEPNTFLKVLTPLRILTLFGFPLVMLLIAVGYVILLGAFTFATRNDYLYGLIDFAVVVAFNWLTFEAGRGIGAKWRRMEAAKCGYDKFTHLKSISVTALHLISLLVLLHVVPLSFALWYTLIEHKTITIHSVGLFSVVASMVILLMVVAMLAGVRLGWQSVIAYNSDGVAVE